MNTIKLDHNTTKMIAHRGLSALEPENSIPTLTQEIVREIHEENLEVNCWTVNSKEDAERYVSWGWIILRQIYWSSGRIKEKSINLLAGRGSCRQFLCKRAFKSC